jgi:hypothetical protein
MDATQQNELMTAYQQQLARAEQQEARILQQEHQLQQLMQQQATHAQSSPVLSPIIHPEHRTSPAPSPRSNEPKPPRPDTYDGRLFSSSKSNVTTWLAEMQQYMEATDIPQHRRVIHAATYLRGTALLAWQTYRKLNPNAALGWEQFELWFLHRFQPIAASKTARAQLRTLCQEPGRSVATYNDAFLRIMQMITDMNEADQVEYYKHGLNNREVANWVDRTDPKTLMEAMECAQREDLRKARFNRAHPSFPRPVSSFSSYPSTSSSAQQAVPMELGQLHGEGEDMEHDMYNEYDMSDEQGAAQQLSFMSRRPAPRRPFVRPSGAPSGTTPAIPKLTPAERQRCMKEHLCFRCRQKGHGALNCPSFPNNRNSAPSKNGQAQ